MITSSHDRVEAADWETIHAELDEIGCALIGPLLTDSQASELAAMYTVDTRFRSTIDMTRYRFGSGEYRYFAHAIGRSLRNAVGLPHPCATASRWCDRASASVSV